MSRLASTKPLDPEVVRHVGRAAERCPSPSYSPPGSPPAAAARMRAFVGAEGESVIRYHASNQPVPGGLLERSEGVKRTVWVGSLEPTVASEHAVRSVMRQAGHVAAVHLVKPSERSVSKKPWALVVYREIVAAERAVSAGAGPLPGAQAWRIAMVRPERLPGKQLTIVLDGWRENKSPSRPRRASLDQLEADIATYQQQRQGLATAPVRGSARGPASPSRSLVQDMTRHSGAVGSRGSMGFASTSEFGTPSQQQQQPSFTNSGSPRNFFGIQTPNSVHRTPREVTRLEDKLDQYEQVANDRDTDLIDQRKELGTTRTQNLLGKSSSTKRAVLGSHTEAAEAGFVPLATVEPKQLLSYRQPDAALYRLAYRAMNRLLAAPVPEPAPPSGGTTSPRANCKPPKKPASPASQVVEEESFANCMDSPSDHMRLAVETVCWLLKLSTDLVAMQDLVHSGGLLPAMHHLDPSTLDDATAHSLRGVIAKLLHMVNDNSLVDTPQRRLEAVLLRNERRPSPVHALCVWLYATYLCTCPEETLSKRQQGMWGFVNLSLERRLVAKDPRLQHAVAWAKTTDLLRHVPDEQLQAALQHASVVKSHPGQTVLRTGSTLNKITLVLAGTVTATLTKINASAVARSNAAQTLELWERQNRLGALVRYCSAAMYGSLGDTVLDDDGNLAHRHHEEWHRAIAEAAAANAGQQWHLKAKLQSSRGAKDVRVPLILGPGAAIGRDKAVAECKRMSEMEHRNGDRAAAAKRQWPAAANTTVRCATPALMLEFSRPKDVIAIGLAHEAALKEKFTELFRFSGEQN